MSNHTAGVHALRSYLKLICEYELHSLPNGKVSGAKDHGENNIKVRPPMIRHLLRNRLFKRAFVREGRLSQSAQNRQNKYFHLLYNLPYFDPRL